MKSQLVSSFDLYYLILVNNSGLISMGADITKDLHNNKLIIRGGKILKGTNIDCSSTPDALPILSVIGSIAEGTTILHNISGVREKETDRVAVMEKELEKMGAEIESDANKMIIHGGKKLKGAIVESHSDHRVAMSLSVAGLFAEGETFVNNVECVNVSFPNFYKILNETGAGFELI